MTAAVAVFISQDVDVNYDYDEMDVWHIYVGDEDANALGKTYTSTSADRAFELGQKMSRESRPRTGHRVTNLLTQRRASGRKEATMAANSLTIADAEAVCREFAAEFTTANVQRAIALAEAGTLSWFEVETVFRQSLAQGLAEVG
jgi:hypothetical protein